MSPHIAAELQQEAASPHADAARLALVARRLAYRPPGLIGRRERCRLWAPIRRRPQTSRNPAPSPTEAAPYLPICDAADINS